MPCWTRDDGTSAFPAELLEPPPQKPRRSRNNASQILHERAVEAIRLAERALLTLAEQVRRESPTRAAVAIVAAEALCRQREIVSEGKAS